MRAALLKRRIDGYRMKGQLTEQADTWLAPLFLEKARKNFTVANLLSSISVNEQVKRAAGLPAAFEAYEWVVIASYYAMYAAGLAALARLGFRSKSHAATIAVLEYAYVLQQKLEPRHLRQLARVRALSEELVGKLARTKTRRETAQYEATPAVSAANAAAALADAEEFLRKIEEILTE